MVLEKRQENPGETSSESAGTSTPKREKKKRASSSLSQLILQAFETQSNSRKTLSLAALKKFLTEAGYNLSKNNMRLKRELRVLVSNGLLIRVTGSGASGSFRFGKNQTKAGRKAEKVKAKKGTPKKAETKRQPKKTQKKQPAVNKPKGLRGQKSANSGKKRQLIKHPPGKPN